MGTSREPTPSQRNHPSIQSQGTQKIKQAKAYQKERQQRCSADPTMTQYSRINHTNLWATPPAVHCGAADSHQPRTSRSVPETIPAGKPRGRAAFKREVKPHSPPSSASRETGSRAESSDVESKRRQEAELKTTQVEQEVREVAQEELAECRPLCGRVGMVGPNPWSSLVQLAPLLRKARLRFARQGLEPCYM
ncbi:hypothetical protein L917_09723 [Phytophthora nicotianae]|uniref:Uncharacterized protein n=1 Tax=Phytophthora nicotianae TaxID=4792 RepID=W2L337_PHYNI|nr:hypothetical protein L917_09723 [Phytophthora nicotianae]